MPRNIFFHSHGVLSCWWEALGVVGGRLHMRPHAKLSGATVTKTCRLDGCKSNDGAWPLAWRPQQPCAILSDAVCLLRHADADMGTGYPLGEELARGDSLRLLTPSPSAATAVETGFSLPNLPDGGPGARDELYNASIRGDGHYPPRREGREPLGKALCIY